MNSILTKSIINRLLVKKDIKFNLICDNNNLYLLKDKYKCKINLKINRKPYYSSNNTNNYQKELILNLIEVKRSQLSGLKKNEVLHLDHNINRKHFIIDDFTIDTQLESNNSKKRKRESFNYFKDYISASKVRNFLIEDPFLDYLKMFGSNKIKNNYEYTQDKFTQHLFKKGYEFEEDVIKKLYQNFNYLQIEQVCHNVEDVHNIKNLDKTIDCMKRGVDIIYQGLLVDKQNKFYGSPDLIIKNTVIDILFPGIQYDIKSKCKFLDNEHYVICDIKGSTIHMNSDDITMRNSGSMKAFKGQLHIYQRMLNSIQETNNTTSIIWAKNKKNNNNQQEYHTNDLSKTYGLIKYADKDSKYIELVDNAVKWLKELKKDGSTWKLYPKPSHDNLYPNMKNEMNGKYNEIKKKYAKDIKEITLVYHCGVKRRKLALKNNVNNFSDKNLNSKLMGFKDTSKIGKVVDKILDVNRSDNLIIPKKISNNLFDWRNASPLEIFIDFETLNIEVNGINKTRIFMIGIGYEYNKKYIEKCFVMKNNSFQGEIDMFDEFYSKVEELEKEFECQAKYFHWYDAEPIFYNKFLARTKDLNFIDLEKIFRTEPICIKGCYNFKLKSVATAMFNHNMIKTCWDNNSECSDGRLAMILSNLLYKKYNNNFTALVNDNTMKDIIKYNLIDVKVLYEILFYIRKHH